MTQHQTNDGPLRWVLRANAVFSALFGLACLLAANEIAGVIFARTFQILGFSSADLLRELGLALLIFAGLVMLCARRGMLSKTYVRLIVLADLVWVAESAVLLAVFGSYFTTSGVFLTAGTGLVVLVFAMEQILGLLWLYQGCSEISLSCKGGHMSLRASRRTTASAERAWRVMSQQEAYAAVAENIRKVEVIDGQGEGMTRRCSDTKGRSWTETCTLWDEGRALAFRVHTKAADYPYPIAELSGEWALEPVGKGTMVHMTFEAQGRSGLIDHLIFQAMAASFPGLCDRLLGKWIEVMEGGAEVSGSRFIPSVRKPQSA